jgi:hypothetical protein
MRVRYTALTIGTMTALLLSYLAACAYIKNDRQAAYDSVKIGDTVDTVITRFGSPSMRDGPDKIFARYASSKCEPPCVERLWFENRLALDIEAWSVSVGSNGRVIDKYHWVSP